jgi:hypothetical protein
MTWHQICRTEQFKGLWIALDGCRYDDATLKPIEGDVVDSDEELAELCSRMREAGNSSCAILFCDGEVLVEQHQLTSIPASSAAGARSH